MASSKFTSLALLAIATVAVSSQLASAALINVALGKTVTLNGSFGSNPGLAQSLTDGVYRPKNTQWQDGTVWWVDFISPNNTVDVDLAGTFSISALNVQADDNDAYVLQYKDTNGNWNLAWAIPNFDFEPFGMQTRPNAFDDTQLFFLNSPIVATALRFFGNANDGDRLFSVAEIQAYGEEVAPVPAPASALILLAAAVPFALRTVRRSAAK